MSRFFCQFVQGAVAFAVLITASIASANTITFDLANPTVQAFSSFGVG